MVNACLNSCKAGSRYFFKLLWNISNCSYRIHICSMAPAFEETNVSHILLCNYNILHTHLSHNNGVVWEAPCMLHPSVRSPMLFAPVNSYSDESHVDLGFILAICIYYRSSLNWLTVGHAPLFQFEKITRNTADQIDYTLDINWW